MNNEPARMINQEEEDWEAGEELPKNLRPSAPAFVPRPPQPQAVKTPFQPQLLARRPAVEPKAEEDDDWFGSARRPVTNRQLWDSANNAPPPVLISPSPTHGSMPVNTVKILRRDPSSQQKKSPGPSIAGQKSLSEREEEYRLARERIFGKEAAATTSPLGQGQGGGGRTPTTTSGKSSPADRNFDLVPTQVKRSPISREGTPGANGREGSVAVGGGNGSRTSSGSGGPRSGGGGGGGAAGREKDKGVLRQPRGPGMGGGFGRV